jgi:hypothetical protein
LLVDGGKRRRWWWRGSCGPAVAAAQLVPSQS